MGRVRVVGVGVGLSAATGLSIYGLWPRLGLPLLGGPLDAPFPDLWRWFFAVWLPLLFPAFTAVHVGLVQACGEAPAGKPARRALDWDRWSYVGLPLFLAALAAWRHLGDWRLALGAVYVGLLGVKTLGLVVTVYRTFVPAAKAGPGSLPGPLAAAAPGSDADEGGRAPDPRALGRVLFWTAFLLYAWLAPYVVTAVSTAGDEQVYLLNTVSLLTDHDTDIRANAARGDYRSFYWGRSSPTRWKGSFVAFPTLLLPGYASVARILPHYPLAGRLGATWTIALCAAVLGVQVYRLCRDLGASRPAALWGWIVIAFTPPVLTHASHLYPELPAACAAVLGVRALWRLSARPWSALAAVIGVAGVLVLLKARYAAIGLGLLAAAAVPLTARRAKGPLVVLGASVLLGAGLLVGTPMRALIESGGSPARVLGILTGWTPYTASAWVGLFADQEFGLLFYAPHFCLAALGLPALWGRRRRACLALLGLIGLYLFVLVQYRWNQWDAGWTPPPRFVLPIAPLLVPLIAEAFERRRGSLLAAVNTGCLIWSGLLGAVLSVVPFWRYNGLIGRSTVLQAAGGWLGLDLARFFPSLRAPTAWTWIALALGAVALIAGAWAGARNRRARPGGWGRGAVWLAPGQALTLVLGVGTVWLAAAALVPTWAVEAEAMHHLGGLQFGSYVTQPILWVMRRDGELWEPIVTWPGLTRVTVLAGGLTTTGQAPRITLLLDGQTMESWELQAGAGVWAEASYTAWVPTGFGHPRLTLQIAGALDQRRPPAAPRLQYAYVDRVEIRWTRGSGERRE